MTIPKYTRQATIDQIMGIAAAPGYNQPCPIEPDLLNSAIHYMRAPAVIDSEPDIVTMTLTEDEALALGFTADEVAQAKRGEIIRSKRAQPISDAKITQAELQELFGTHMPVEAFNLIADAPDNMTIREVRKEIRKIALRPRRLTGEEIQAIALQAAQGFPHGMGTLIDPVTFAAKVLMLAQGRRPPEITHERP